MKKMPLRRAIAASIATVSLLGLTGVGLIDDLFAGKRTGGSLCC